MNTDLFLSGLLINKTQSVVFVSQDSAKEEQPDDRELVLVKEGSAKEEVNDSDVADQLLLHEDGKRHRRERS